jgi:hypothetical protein
MRSTHRTVTGERVEELELPQAVSMLVDECRMVLPGIQALFGFQLIAVFNQGFAEKLSDLDQHLHLAAIVFVVIAIGMVMAPAAYHRQSSPMHVSDHIVRVSTNLLKWGMLPLAIALCIDLYVVSVVIIQTTVAAILALLMLVLLLGLWYGFARVKALQRFVAGERE